MSFFSTLCFFAFMNFAFIYFPPDAMQKRFSCYHSNRCDETDVILCVSTIHSEHLADLLNNRESKTMTDFLSLKLLIQVFCLLIELPWTVYLFIIILHLRGTKSVNEIITSKNSSQYFESKQQQKSEAGFCSVSVRPSQFITRAGNLKLGIHVIKLWFRPNSGAMLWVSGWETK